MNVVIVHAPETDPHALARAVEAAGLGCEAIVTADAARDAELAKAEVLLVDAWHSPDEVRELCRRSGNAPPVIVAFDGDQSMLGMHAAEHTNHFIVMPASPVLVENAVLNAAQAHRLQLLDIGEHERERRAKIDADVQTARNIQAGFLPHSLPEVDGYTMAAFLQPAREVAGDFYDAFPGAYGRRVAFSVSDICDKGVGAALFMAIFRTLYRSLMTGQSGSLAWLPTGSISGITAPGVVDEMDDEPEDPFGDIVARARHGISTGAGLLQHAVFGTNEYILRNHGLDAYFSTTFFGLLDPESGYFHYVNAGHNPPILIRADGTMLMLEPTGPAVGILEDATFDVHEQRLDPGDSLLVYSDGAPEAKNEQGEFFTRDRLLDVARRPGDSASELVTRVVDALRRHMGSADPYDDITILTLCRNKE